MGVSPITPELWRTEKVAERRKPPGRPRNNAQSSDGLRRAATTLVPLGSLRSTLPTQPPNRYSVKCGLPHEMWALNQECMFHSKERK